MARSPLWIKKRLLLVYPELKRWWQFSPREAWLTSLVQQSQAATVEGEGFWVNKMFMNPGKYEIPAGGIGKNGGYNGPSLNILNDVDKQILINGSVSIIDPFAANGGDTIIDQRQNKSHSNVLCKVSTRTRGN